MYLSDCFYFVSVAHCLRQQFDCYELLLGSEYFNFIFGILSANKKIGRTTIRHRFQAEKKTTTTTLESRKEGKTFTPTLLHKVVSSGKLGTRHNNTTRTDCESCSTWVPWVVHAEWFVFYFFLFWFIVDTEKRAAKAEDKYNFLILIKQPPWRMQNL